MCLDKGSSAENDGTIIQIQLSTGRILTDKRKRDLNTDAVYYDGQGSLESRRGSEDAATCA